MRATEEQPDQLIRYSVFVRPEQLAALRHISKKTGVGIGSIVRKGLDMGIGWFEELDETIEAGVEAIAARGNRG
jgi:hypothetical protein